MIVTVYSGKGGVGKTPISVNLALEHDWAIGTNDTLSVLSLISTIPEERKIEIEPGEPFPQIPAEIDIVFDLGGALNEGSKPSILSAIEQSDLVIVPVSNDLKAIAGTIITLSELTPFKKSILLVATKLERTTNEPKAIPIEQTRGFLNIKNQLGNAGFGDFPILPLKLSKSFETIFETGVSIEELVRQGGIQAYSFRDVGKQFEAISNFIKNKHG